MHNIIILNSLEKQEDLQYIDLASQSVAGCTVDSVNLKQLHIEKDPTDNIDGMDIVNSFIENSCGVLFILRAEDGKIPSCVETVFSRWEKEHVNLDHMVFGAVIIDGNDMAKSVMMLNASELNLIMSGSTICTSEADISAVVSSVCNLVLKLKNSPMETPEELPEVEDPELPLEEPELPLDLPEDENTEILPEHPEELEVHEPEVETPETEEPQPEDSLDIDLSELESDKGFDIDDDFRKELDQIFSDEE